MILQPLDSTDNKTIRSIRRLLSNRRFRGKAGETVLEGPRMIREALEAGTQVLSVLYSPKFVSHEHGRSLIAHLGMLSVRTIYVTDRILDELSDVETHQGIMGIIRVKLPEQGDWPEPQGTSTFFLVASGIQDPGNLGTLIRTAHAAGVHAVGMTSNTVDPYNPKALRSSAGSAFRIPLLHLGENWMDSLLKRGVTLRAAVVSDGTPYYDVDWDVSVALVLGNEGNGLAAEEVKQMERVTIPMHRTADSLNVSVAGAVMLFHAAWDRRRKRMLQ